MADLSNTLPPQAPMTEARFRELCRKQIDRELAAIGRPRQGLYIVPPFVFDEMVKSGEIDKDGRFIPPDRS
jgi:hypothetical protein